MICLSCNHEIREGGAPTSEISEIYKTTTTGSIKWCACDTPKPAQPCSSTSLHSAHDNCPGVGMEVRQ